MSAAYLGVDIGKTGALGLVGEDGEFLDVLDMPYIKDDIHIQAIEEWCQLPRDGARLMAICIEQQQARPIGGEPCPVCHQRRSQGASSTFKLGVSYGMMLGWAYRVSKVAGIPLYVVHPSKWKPAMKVTADKEETRLRAVREFPGAPLKFKKHHGRAESLFLADYGRQRYLRTDGAMRI